MVNWTLIFNGTAERSVERFVDREISGRQLLNSFWDTEARSKLNTAFRRRGTDGVRELARKALSRRVS